MGKEHGKRSLDWDSLLNGMTTSLIQHSSIYQSLKLAIVYWIYNLCMIVDICSVFDCEYDELCIISVLDIFQACHC